VVDYRRNPKADKIIEAALGKAVDAAAIVLQQEIKKTLGKSGASNIGSGGTPSKPGGPPSVGTGNLRRSIQINRSKVKGPKPMAAVGSNLVYAPIIERGKTITPKNAKALAVPIGVEGKQAAKRAGWRSDKNSAGRIRSLDLAYIARPGKDPLLARVDVKGRGKSQRAQITPLFVLKRSVTIRARPFMRPTMRSTNVQGRMLAAAGKSFRTHVGTMGAMR